MTPQPKPQKRPKRTRKRLQRRKWLRPRPRPQPEKPAARRRPKKSSARRNVAYRYFVRTLPCIVCGATPVDASHVSLGPDEKGVGLKVDDIQCVPHCRKCHREWEERRGFCWGWSKKQRWERAIEWVAETQLKAVGVVL